MTISVQGQFAPGFEPVAEAFAAAFAGQPTMGGGLAVRVAGERVVNLWAGVADERTGAPWQETTASVVFSCTKGLASILAARLVQEGRLDYEAPVARYWPEFAAAGKGEVLVKQLLSHKAGLSAPDVDATLEDILDWQTMVTRLAAQAPIWPLGSGHAYHALTHGWLAGELIRRITGMSVGAFFAETIAAPLSAAAWIGLPASERSRVAHLQVDRGLRDLWAAEAAKPADGPVNWTYRAMTLGRALPAELVTPDGGFNDPRVQAAEIPGAGGIATADALASIWSATVTETDGVRLLDPATVALYNDPELIKLFPDLAERCRAEAAKLDLADLETEVPAPVAGAVQNPSKAQALGWLFVSEGSKLGAAFLIKRTVGQGPCLA